MKNAMPKLSIPSAELVPSKEPLRAVTAWSGDPAAKGLSVVSAFHPATGSHLPVEVWEVKRCGSAADVLPLATPFARQIPVVAVTLDLDKLLELQQAEEKARLQTIQKAAALAQRDLNNVKEATCANAASRIMKEVERSLSAAVEGPATRLARAFVRQEVVSLQIQTEPKADRPQKVAFQLVVEPQH